MIRLFGRRSSPVSDEGMKYLIAGLGNIGEEYKNTRHNIGFNILDAFQASNVVFTQQRYGAVATCRVKNKILILLKPNTYVNLSGKAVHYWLHKEKIPLENLLVVLDDLALPFGTLRLKPSGNDGGHNGLKNIDDFLGTNTYARLRFGIGNQFPKGAQIDYVLSTWDEEESRLLDERIPLAGEMIRSFALQGIQRTMNLYNNK